MSLFQVKTLHLGLHACNGEKTIKDHHPSGVRIILQSSQNNSGYVPVPVSSLGADVLSAV